MPRNGSGQYTPPSNTWNPATPETTILTDDWNTTLADMATALSQSLASDGQTTASARIAFAQGVSVSTGTLSAPAISVIGDADTGWYFPAANQASLVAGGIAVIEATSTTVNFPVAVTFSGGSGITGNLTISGNLTVNGNSTIGDTSGDTLTVAATGTFNGPQTFVGAVTVPDASFSNAKLATVPTATLKGRVTAATGVVEDLTATQATTILNPVVGDSGSGGTKGLVPAPAAGDTADRKVLLADGTWARQTVFAYALINGSTGAIVKGFNVASATAVGAGVFDVVFTDAAADGNYSIEATGRHPDATGFVVMSVSNTTVPTTAGFRVYTAILTIGPTITAAPPDFFYVTVYQ